VEAIRAATQLESWIHFEVNTVYIQWHTQFNVFSSVMSDKVEPVLYQENHSLNMSDFLGCWIEDNLHAFGGCFCLVD